MGNYTSGSRSFGVFDFETTCDACSAANSYYTVNVDTERSLEFCSHCFNKHRLVIDAKGYIVEDRTHLINAKPSVSANVDG